MDLLATLVDLLYSCGQLASLAGLLAGARYCVGVPRIDRAHVRPWPAKAARLLTA
jgi:hypothetical protein